jgi:hypothetical protein
MNHWQRRRSGALMSGMPWASEIGPIALSANLRAVAAGFDLGGRASPFWVPAPFPIGPCLIPRPLRYQASASRPSGETLALDELQASAGA